MANHSLKQNIDSVLKRIFIRKGDIFAEIMINWAKIVGDEFSGQIYPYDIKYYTSNNKKVTSLALKITENGNSLTLQFSEIIIIERINNYLGYNAITKLKFI